MFHVGIAATSVVFACLSATEGWLISTDDGSRRSAPTYIPGIRSATSGVVILLTAATMFAAYAWPRWRMKLYFLACAFANVAVSNRT